MKGSILMDHGEVTEMILTYLDDESIEEYGGIGPLVLKEAERVDEQRSAELVFSFIESEFPSKLQEIPDELASEWEEANTAVLKAERNRARA
ncbi:hypothetical protein KKF82_09065 [Patescibacteria group bacterium]|nr:hypothetical protein [Patescibacteria group bacterium]